MMMNRLIYIPLSAALALPISQPSTEWMQFAATAAYDRLPSPYQYRVLFAYSFHFLDNVLGAHIAAWLFWLVSLSVFLLLMDGIITAVNPNTGREYLMASIALIPVMIWFHAGGGFWSILEGIFIAGALLALIRGKTAVMYPLVFLATLSRETAVLIPVMVLAVTRNWKHAAGGLVVWAATYGSLRLIIVAAPSDLTPVAIWKLNTGPQLIYAAMGLPLFGWLFWYAWRGWKRAVGVMRGAAVIVPIYIVLFGIFGIWYEWRWILALYPVLIPLAGMQAKEKASAVVYGDDGYKGVYFESRHLPEWEPRNIYQFDTGEGTYIGRDGQDGDIEWELE